MALEAMKIDESHRARMLTQRELHSKIEHVTEVILRGAAAPASDEPMCPRIISAADLVRRMKPFMVYN
jgi:hypothetical protein